MPPAALQAQIQFNDFGRGSGSLLTTIRSPVLEKLQCPVLALSGDRDLQVDSTENVPAVAQGGLTRVRTKTSRSWKISGVNHLFSNRAIGIAGALRRDRGDG